MAVEEIKPYDTQGNKTEQVEQMFDSIAPSYDFMNHAMTFGLDRVWRDKAISLLMRRAGASLQSPQILDVACGTGDVSFRLRELIPSQVTGIDLSSGMLAQARQKLAAPRYKKFEGSIFFQEADCLELPFADDSFDIITVAYGVRNFEHLDKGYAGMLRVLRPGGILCVLELCEPSNALMRGLYRLYSRCVIPLMGRLVSGDRKAYSYLLKSIEECPQRKKMTALMERCGFREARFKALFPGTVAVYTALKKYK